MAISPALSVVAFPWEKGAGVGLLWVGVKGLLLPVLMGYPAMLLGTVKQTAVLAAQAG